MSGYAEGEGWEPIGDDVNNFKGTFDGNNYKITNLTINRPNSDYQSLFGVIYTPPFRPSRPGEPPWVISELLNIILINVDIKGNNYVSGLAGENIRDNITNCYVTGNVKGNNHIGGLVGDSSGIQEGPFISGHITNCYFTGAVEGNNSVGGLVGRISMKSNIINCYSIGNIEGNDNVGGLAGVNHGNIASSYSASNVEGNNNVGGLIGGTLQGYIINSYSIGDVYGNNLIGGLVGNSEFGNVASSYSTSNVEGNNFVGGLVGRNDRGLITNCYSIGNIEGIENVGGLVGYNDVYITNSYWNTETSGQSTSEGGEGKNTVEMKQQTTFVDWDFSTIWDVEEGISYPYLYDNEQVPHPQ